MRARSLIAAAAIAAAPGGSGRAGDPGPGRHDGYDGEQESWRVLAPTALDNIQQSRAFVIASVTSYCPWFDYRGKSPGLLA